jgi:hypothetical protein
MKRYFSALSILFVALAAMFFTSCEVDEPTYAGSKQVAFFCQPNEDLTAVADLQLIYTDANGNTVTEPLEQAFNTRFEVTKLPSSGSFRVKAVKKAKIPAKAQYGMILSYVFERGSKSKVSVLSQIAKSEAAIDSCLEKFNQHAWEWEFDASGSSLK